MFLKKKTLTSMFLTMFFKTQNIGQTMHPTMLIAHPYGLTVAFVRILGLKTHWIWFLDTQNTFYLMVKGLKNAYLMHFPSLHSWFRCSVCFYLKCSSSHNQRVIQRVKKLFFCQNLFQLMYNHKQKSNAPLRKQAPKAGGCATWTNAYKCKMCKIVKIAQRLWKMLKGVKKN